MMVRPDDLANLCSSYVEFGTRKMPEVELRNRVQKSMTIESDSSALEIVQAAVACGLVTATASAYAITAKGWDLGQRQRRPGARISDNAKEFLLKKVYLDPSAGTVCCGHFLTSFRADTTLATFVLDRTRQESAQQRGWLKALSRVGLLDVDECVAKVRRPYLEAVNLCLRQMREGDTRDDATSAAEKAKTGEIAENCAVLYERERLSRRGYPELASLVGRISLVDASAGYDILSYRGSGKSPLDEIQIEVKGTRRGEVDFVWSANERRVAREKRTSYWIYVFTDVDLAAGTSAGPVRINDPIANLGRRGYCVEPLDVRVRHA